MSKKPKSRYTDASAADDVGSSPGFVNIYPALLQVVLTTILSKVRIDALGRS